MKAADARADVYSMGMILLDCLAGNTLAGVSDRPTKLRREAGLHFDALVARATAFRPEDRFQTIVELRDALSTLPDRNPQAFRNS